MRLLLLLTLPAVAFSADATCTNYGAADCTVECGTLTQVKVELSDGGNDCSLPADYDCQGGDNDCVLVNAVCSNQPAACESDCASLVMTATATVALGGGAECDPAVGAETVCTKGTDACDLDAVPCAGTWATCADTCADVAFTVSQAAQYGGAACEAEDGATRVCANGVDACVKVDATCTSLGASDCTADCGTLTQVKVPLEGAGADCDLPADHVCQAGENDCQETADADAVCSAFTTEDCTIACGTVTQTKEDATGSGTDCTKAADIVCANDDGACVVTDAVCSAFTVADCTAECGTVAQTKVEAVGGGNDCTIATDITCAADDGDCAVRDASCPANGAAQCTVACGTLSNAKIPAVAGGSDDGCSQIADHVCQDQEGTCVAAAAVCSAFAAGDCTDTCLDVVQTKVDALAGGADCNIADNIVCTNGDGACVITNCDGAYADCTATCEDAVYAVNTPAAGTGTACDAAAGDTRACENNDGLCVKTDCVGTWATCADSCADATYSVSTQAAGAGAACPAAADDTRKCYPGEGACPALCVAKGCNNSVADAKKYCSLTATAADATCVDCPADATAAKCDAVTDATDDGKADCKSQCYTASGGGSDTKSDAASLSMCLAAALPLAFLL